MFPDEAGGVGQGAGGAVGVDRALVCERPFEAGGNGAVAVADTPHFLGQSCVAVAEVRAAAEVAVEIVKIVALLTHGVERAEVGVLLAHIVVRKIFDHFVIGEVIEGSDDGAVPVTKIMVPLGIGHGRAISPESVSA